MNLANIIFGLCSLIGLGIAIPGIYNILSILDSNKDQPIFLAEIQTLFHSLGWAILLLLIFIIACLWYFSRLIDKLNCDLRELPIENNLLIEELNNQILINKTIAGCTHTILHYYRNITNSMDIIMRGMDITNDIVEKVIVEFEKFISLSLTNISSTCSVLTDDQCSACIKIIKDGLIKTHYRDPISYRLRQVSDFHGDKPFIYHVSDNYAFKLITDPNYKETSFFCDDLIENKAYENRNPKWEQLYNATAVVPIEIGENIDFIKRSKSKKRVIGFLCVDNFKGGFEHRDIKDFISSFGDLLFNLYEKFDIFTEIVKEKGIENKRIQTYENWDAN